MKYFFIPILFSSCLVAQTNCPLELKNNTAVTAFREMPPMQPKDAHYFKMDADERKEVDEKFQADVKSGKLKPRVDTVKTIVEEAKQEGNMTHFVLNTLSRGMSYKTNWMCQDNFLYLYPMQKMVVSKGKTPKGKDITFTNYYGTNIIPLKLKVGDTLPTYQNYGFSSPVSYEMTAPKTSFYTDVYGTEWLINSEQTVGATAQSSLIQKFANREVLAEEELTINNKPYKAYKAITEVWTKSDVEITKSSLLGAIAFRAIKKGIDHKTNKLVNANKEGWLVTSLYEWIVPEFGIVKTESYTAEGALIARVINYSYTN